MKNIKCFIYSLSICFFLLATVSCKKNTSFNHYEQLTNGLWDVTEVKDDNGNSITEECEKDDIIRFEEESFTFIEGENICHEEMIFKSGKWEFKDDGEGLKITKTMKSSNGSGTTILVLRYKIISLSDSELVLKSEDEDKTYYYE
ncbi:lipocalin family protein [Brumimicrobium aurantiacum]|uniref:Lipocalin-like domain-containing protein n=1 Tax=Brumimicrobium aurantiacum TaxID=1737063 RepID=A0A3E1F0H6_9FLAO|nr:lipocalin family protein [Brumimicrobium aurantiacum]RFC55308.1 hypothetical protein DXU93_05665 [Brumimicrobium aurantiacum]